ncbi:hypothetical protein [Pseudomonas sp. DWP3-1-2]|uniref:hypothetical protein n=1 Tax=Pseudomonas sp. DWP3-1-2 TaxID=2804645 RepID=UPI003CF957A4
MYVSEDDARPAYDEALNERLTGAATFESTVKRFDIQARDIRRGFQVNQAIRSFRVAGIAVALTSLKANHNYASLAHPSGKSKKS